MAHEEGAVRAAETLLRSAGQAIKLRLPGMASGGDDAGQMGFSEASFQDAELGPAVFRKAGDRRELLVSAEAVRRLVGSLAFDSAALLFGAAVGVVVGDEVLGVESAVPVEAGGVAVCYRVRLRA